jgi:hypothetical protein
MSKAQTPIDTPTEHLRRPPDPIAEKPKSKGNDNELEEPLTIDEMLRIPSIKRYNLALPTDLFDEVQRIADRNSTSVLEIFRKFIKIGLLIAKFQEMEDTTFIIRQGNTEKEIVIM